MTVVESAPRRVRYAKLALARRALGLDEETYRARLVREVGKDSARKMSLGEMDRVLEAFRRDGFKGKAPYSPRPEVRKVFALWRELTPILRQGGSRESLRAFVERLTGISDPNFLSGPQAGVVIEALKAWGERGKSKSVHIMAGEE